MHLPSKNNYDEKLSTPGMLRFAIASGAVSDREATLIVKASSLMIKFLITNVHLRLIFFRLLPDNILLYAIEVHDTPGDPAIIWSVAETPDEIEAIYKLFQGEYLALELFNKACANVASSEPKFVLIKSPPPGFLENIALVTGGSQSLRPRVEAFFRSLESPSSACADIVLVADNNELTWKQMAINLYTNSHEISEFRIVDGREGDQQEHLAVWLSDNLSTSGAYKGPIVHEESKPRDLTDVLLAYSNGVFLFESKAVSIFDKVRGTNRDKLKKLSKKGIKKAINQLPGACKNIVNGLRITTSSGCDIALPRDIPIHCVVLISDIELIADDKAFGGSAIREFAKLTGHMLHIVDPDALMGLVINAIGLSRSSQTISQIMAFDAILAKRWECSLDLDTAFFRFTMRSG